MYLKAVEWVKTPHLYSSQQAERIEKYAFS